MYLEPVRAMLRKECYYEAQALIERELQRRSPEAYQPLGTLTLETLNDSEPSSYRRARDLETATFTVATDTAQRGAFISYPDTCWLTAG